MAVVRPWVLLNKLNSRAAPRIIHCFGDDFFLIQTVLDFLQDILVEGSDVPVAAEEYEFPSGVIDALEACRTYPLWSSNRLIVLKRSTRYEKRLSASAKEKQTEYEDLLLKYCSNPTEFSYLIIVSEQRDGRRKFYRDITKLALEVDCSTLKQAEWGSAKPLLENILKVELDSAVVHWLSMHQGDSLQEMIDLLEQLITRHGNSTKVSLEMVEKVFGESVDENIFQYTDALTEARPGSALKILRHLIKTGEPPQRIAFMILQHFRLLYWVKLILDQGDKPENIATRMSLNPYRAKRLIDVARGISRSKLKDLQNLVLNLDLNLKTSGGDSILLLEQFTLQSGQYNLKQN